MRRWACLLALLAAWPALTQDLRLELGAFQPYRMNTARLLSQEGFSGDLEVSGRLWDGRDIPLFRTHLAAETRAVELVFYLDEDVKGVRCQVGGRSVDVDLAGIEGRHGGVPPKEATLRGRMRSLDPPVHFAPRGEASERFSLAGTDLVMAGFQASTTLFGPVPSRIPLWWLGGFAVAALVVSALPTRRPWTRLLLLAGLSVPVALAVLKVANPRPTLFSVSFPGAVSGTRVAGSLERSLEEKPGYTRMSWNGGAEGGLSAPGADRVELVGLWAPAGRGIPLAEAVPQGALVRFSSPPLVSVLEGQALLSSPDFITGWVVHGH